MENSIKAICNTSTYLDKYHSNTNFSNNESLLVGSINNRSLGNNRYISLLNFQLSELSPDSIKKAYLYLFIEDIKPDYKNSFGFGILGNYSNVDIAAIDWSSLPKKDYTKLLNHIIHGYNVGYYLKINVTSLIRSLATHNESYNIFLLPQNQDSNSIIKLSSFESKYPPYLDIITYNIDSTNNIDLSEELNIETYIEEHVEENTYDDEETETNNSEDISTSKESSNVERDSVKNQEEVTLINHLLNKVVEILVNQDLKLNYSNESLSEEISSLSNKLANIDDKISSLDENSTNLKQNDIETLNINMSSLNKILVNQDLKLNSLNSYSESLGQEINSLSNKVANIDDKISLLDENSTNLRQSDIETLNINISSLDEVLANQDLKLNSLNSYNESLSEEISSLSSKLANIDDEISLLDEKFVSLKQNDIETLNINMSSLSNEILELKALLPNLSVNLENLREAINDFTKTEKLDFSNLNSVSSQLLELSSDLNSLTKLIGSISVEPIN
ncbi:DNRLRE domain-containing protein [Clostridium beijerinckii]|uniref:RNase H-like nuclease (RuvC/YqgF family) n=1 Tax=Clostridium beijerinckii TaxID=1520 RepID=A0AAX0AXV8_CLOBE|nr:putative RNase H-like nuclease (RuvC/YqgF family) [Clostridium beijerinckii]NYC72997.1 putative RNase H-like nuclease (RuvC/YqgF family) [Clostridium beijerinckii]